MSTINKIGIWMDYSIACLIEFSNDSFESITISADHFCPAKENISDDYRLLTAAAEEKQSAYYKSISDMISYFDEVLIFGPTDAKVDLFKILRADRNFDKIKIETRQMQRYTENARVKFCL